MQVNINGIVQKEGEKRKLKEYVQMMISCFQNVGCKENTSIIGEPKLNKKQK